jgi:NAD(P)-dependent dehydrogenase (short-subunit alcohol dehydrogenase family)
VTVYVTGRSVRGGPSAPDRAGSIEETAEEVPRRGGHAMAVRCDHTIDVEIAELFERVRRERGRLDLLVNNAWGGYEQRADSASAFFGAPCREQPLRRWQAMFEPVSGPRSSPAAWPRRC